MLVATRAVALAAALFGFYFFFTEQNIFASFGAMLLGSGALMIAFPAVTRWLCRLSGQAATSETGTSEAATFERENMFRSDVVTVVVTDV
jgi:hypothetical protein